MIKITNLKSITDKDQFELIPYNVDTKYKHIVNNNVVTITNNTGDRIIIDFTSKTINIIE